MKEGMKTMMASDAVAESGTTEKILEIFTDGACKGNPGVGGWGAYLRYGDAEKKLSGAEAFTTNNKMELRAAIEALKAVKRPCKIVITTDSSYVKQGINGWIFKWKANNWQTSNKQPVKNVELWQELDALCSRLRPHWRWVKGHSGHPGNETADALANQAIAALKTQGG